MKAFLGIGLLGANFVKSMLNKGEQVQVWNRTAAKAEALAHDGAKAFADVAEAVQNADVIHLTLKDDAAVDEVLAKAAPGFKTGAIIIDHSTTSVDGAIRRCQQWKQAGFDYIHAPVFMGPVNALEGTGIMLISGDQQLIERLKPELLRLTGKLVNLGTTVGKAAGIKLVGNLFLISLTAGLSDALSLAKGLDVSSADVMDLFTDWNPAAQLRGRLQKMIDGDFSQPSWELAMARKDAGLMIDAVNGDLLTIPGVVKAMDSMIDKGHGSDDWMIISNFKRD